MDRASLNLTTTQGDHRRLPSLYQSSDILLRFKTQATERRVVSKLKVEYRTKQGAVGNFGYKHNRK